MKLYVLAHQEWDEHEIIGVFSSLEKANQPLRALVDRIEVCEHASGKLIATYHVRDGEILHYRRMPESPDKSVDDVQHLVGLGMRRRLAEGLVRLIGRLDLEGDSYDD